MIVLLRWGVCHNTEPKLRTALGFGSLYTMYAMLTIGSPSSFWNRQHDIASQRYYKSLYGNVTTVGNSSK